MNGPIVGALTSGSAAGLLRPMMTQDGGDRRVGPIQRLRSLARSTLDTIDRILHTVRRRAARRTVRRTPKPPSVLFICQGNIYRSPFAEAVLRRPGLLDDRNMSVASAGFVGPGRPSPDDAIAAADRRGVDLRGHRSRLMTPAMLRRPTLPVVMDTRQRAAVAARYGRRRSEILVLGDLDPEPIRWRRIRDPWDGSEEILEPTYDRIDRCVRELARVLNESESPDVA